MQKRIWVCKHMQSHRASRMFLRFHLGLTGRFSRFRRLGSRTRCRKRWYVRASANGLLLLQRAQ